MEPDAYHVDFPTLWVAAEWIEAHCVIPDGFRKGAPFQLYDRQLWITTNHYRVREDAKWQPRSPLRSAAFVNRRSQVIDAQKTGKGPFAAALTCLEAVGPALFAGWAEAGECYVCAEHGCPCGWEYGYATGEPKGMGWPTPLIQLLATSDDQVANVYRPLQAMVRGSVLSEQMLIREGFIRLPNEGLIETVTSSARSRLGNPITFCVQDETGLYTRQNGLRDVAETMRRGLAGMSGRSIETTNCYDPAQNSVAQSTFEGRAADVFRFYRRPPAGSFGDKRERRRILRFNYAGIEHADLDAIEAEIAELMEHDPAQAERFFGNRMVAGKGSWLVEGLWDRTAADVEVADGTPVCLGFDGSDSDDWTALRAETIDGHRFTPTYGPDNRPTIWNPNEWGGQVPRGEVAAAVDEVFDRFEVRLMFADPPDWRTELGEWALKYGERHVVEFWTNKVARMHEALERSVVDLASGRSTHDRCETTAAHVANARKQATLSRRYILSKPAQHQKIDAAMADVLAHEAAMFAHADGWTRATQRYYVGA